MHLLAAKPGGFVDDEGIVDLGQTPANILVLAAADSLIGALAQGLDDIAAEADATLTLPTVRLANWMQLLKPAAYDLYEDKVLEGTQLVVLSLLGGEHYWAYGFERLQAWQAAKPNRHLIVVPGDDTLDSALMGGIELLHGNGPPCMALP